VLSILLMSLLSIPTSDVPPMHHVCDRLQASERSSAHVTASNGYLPSYVGSSAFTTTLEHNHDSHDSAEISSSTPSPIPIG
jgi:hypothetical protein